MRAVEELRWKVDVDVARALRHLAAALNANHEQEIALEILRRHQAAVAELHVRLRREGT